MQDAPKAVWSIPYVSVVFFPGLKQNFIAYRSSKVSWRPDCIFEIHQLLPHLSSSLTDSVPSLNLLYHSKSDFNQSEMWFHC